MCDPDFKKSIATGPIGARRVKTEESKLPCRSQNTVAAIVDVVKVLSDGQWHRKSELRNLVAGYKCEIDTVLDCLDAAESDSGRWVALADERTPEKAPDEEELEED